MLKTMMLTVFLLSSVGAAGCVVVPGRRHGHAAGPGHAPGCHPSQYWDGTTCRHKGKGHGARKHDGRR